MPVKPHEQNRQSWNAATKQHHTHKPDLISRYQSGYNNLHFEEMHLLGELTGKRIAHLQCNDGQDSISIAKFLGGEVTGIDISDYAIEFARNLSTETNIPVNFIRSDIFDWFESNEAPYDVIFTTYGTICWISSLVQWAQGIAKNLKPGGKFVIIDFHPLIGMYEIDWTLQYDYMGGKPLPSDGVGDYVGDDYDGNFKNSHASLEFAWGIGNILGSILHSGLILQQFREYHYLNSWQRFPDLVQEDLGEKQRFYLPKDKPIMPMMFSLVANKAEA